MAGTYQIDADVLPAADHITELLTLDRPNGYQRQLAGSEPASKADRITLIGLHAV